MRPTYKWLLVGPPRSGTSWHLDPWGSNAWNLLLSGKKRWALYPPGKIPPGVRMNIDPFSKTLSFGTDCCTALEWFLEVLPQLSEDELPIEVVQLPGQTIFIPHDWWHCVLNLDLTVSVTQNFLSTSGLRDAIHLLSQGACHYYSSIYPVMNRHPRPETTPLPSLSVPWTGLLLKSLWERIPELRETLSQCSEDFLYGSELTECLTEICKRHGLSPPSPADIFPIWATSNLLFKIHDCTIKLFFHEIPLNLCTQYLTESRALKAVGKLGPSISQCFPSFIGKGIVPFSRDGSPLEVPYLISTHRKGEQLSWRWEHLLDSGKQTLSVTLGETVARLHSCAESFLRQNSSSYDHHLPRPSEEDLKEKAVAARDCDDLSDWLEANVLCSAFFQAQDPNQVWSRELYGHVSSPTPLQTPVTQNASLSVSIKPMRLSTLHEDWMPFVSFLEWRRIIVISRPSEELSMPGHLISQLATYLPAEMESLLPRGPSQIPSAVRPVLIHGDLTHDNLLVSGDDGDALSVVDLADAGFGDPLYDFVAVTLSSLRGDRELMQIFGQSYRKEWKERTNEEWHRSWSEGRRYPLSYCMMCYCLLHEDDALGWLMEEQPNYKEYTSLNEIELALWNCFDHFADLGSEKGVEETDSIV